MKHCWKLFALMLLGSCWLLWTPQPSHAYVEAPHSLGQIVNLSTNIVLMRVTNIDRTRNAIIFTKIRDVKGVHPQKEIRHSIGNAGFEPREWQTVMKWAEVGKDALFFHNGSQSETCIGNYWYQTGGNPNDANGWWGMTHAEPFLLRSFAGRLEKLQSAIIDMLAGKEVVVPCMVDGNKDDLKAAKAKIQRLKVSLKLNDYNPKRDFVGWGGEDFRRLAGMPGFTHISGLTRVDPDAQAISAIDFNQDGKVDLCLAGSGKVALLQNGNDSLSESSLPNAAGCRSATWADYNGDGAPDLLLATPTGPMLFTNLGKGNFRDDTALLPREPGYNVTCANWIDQNGDGLPDILLGNGWHGLRLYLNKGKNANPLLWNFENVSDIVGLGEKGIGGSVKGDNLTVCDLDGDGKADFIYGAGEGLIVRNTNEGFRLLTDSGLRFTTGKVGPILGDYNGDGRPDLFVPQPGGCKLFRNEGNGKFVDVTAASGLSKATVQMAGAAWGDVDNDGKLDLVVGCLRSPNRFYRNKGDGTFEDQSEKLGLQQKVFNTQAVCLVDLNADGVLDMIFNNEGQDACVLLGNPDIVEKRTPVTLQLASRLSANQIKVLDMDGKLQGSYHLSNGDGRGGQAPPLAHFALAPGKYKVELVLTNGERRGQAIEVASGGQLRSLLDEKLPRLE